MNDRELKDLRLAYRMVFDTPDGKRVFDDLWRRCNMYRSTYSEKANETFFLEGQRNVVIWIKEMLTEDNRKLPKQQETE